MIPIYSKVSEDMLLHIIIRSEEVQDGRRDHMDHDDILQIAACRFKKGQTFRPHKHLYKKVDLIEVTRECWVVVKGVVKVSLYDVNDTVIATNTLMAGDITISLSGGHNYEIIEDAVVYEIKSGPYMGQEIDKVFI